MKIQHYQNKVVWQNLINESGYRPTLYYYGAEDDDIELLISKINRIGDRLFFNVFFESKIWFSSDKAKELIKSIENKKTWGLIIDTHYMDKEEAKVVLSFLSWPQSTYSKFILKFADTDDVTEALKAIQNRYSFTYAEIITEKLVSKEAEELALKILDTHFGCSIYLNSEVKALRKMEDKGVQKYL